MSKRRPASKAQPGKPRFAADTRADRARWLTPLAAVALVAACFVAYANSFDGVFLLDDGAYVKRNPRIRDLTDLGTLLSGRRPVVDLTLAINYALGEFNVWGYHLVNVMIHAVAGLALFGVVRRTAGIVLARRARIANGSREAAEGSRRGPSSRSARTQEIENRKSKIDARFASRGIIGNRHATALAFATALIWLVHPLTTQAVTYLVQRGESLMAMFYLLTLYGILRAAQSRRAWPWHLAAVVACAMGMGSKGVMVTAPMTVLLFDRLFLADSFRQVIRQRWGLYLGLFATWLVLWWTDVGPGVLSTSRKVATTGFSFQEFTPFEYLMTQAGVLLYYIRLALWPHPLCLDYHWPVVRNVVDAILPGLVIVVLLMLTLWLLIRRHWVGFALAFFFIVLAPTSSFVPVQDPIFEHRMYLPLAAVVLLAVAGGWALIRQVSAALSWSPRTRAVVSSAILLLAAAPLTAATIARNEVYDSRLAMWADVIAKQPDHARAYDNYGAELYRLGRRDEAEKYYRKAIELDPRMANAYYNLGVVYTDRGRTAKALEFYRRALQIHPKHAQAAANAAAILARKGHVDQAIALLRRTIRMDPVSAVAHHNLAAILLENGQPEEALRLSQKAIALDPQMPDAHLLLGLIHQQAKRLDEAIAAYWKALDLAPDHANAYFALGNALTADGRRQEAAHAYRKALTLEPTHVRAANKLRALQTTGGSSGG